MKLALTLALALSLVACQRSSGAGPDGGDTRPLLVFAAASLTDAFQALEEDFEAANPGVDVRLNFAGSQSLRTQIENGAGAAVFASADQSHAAALHAAELVDPPRVFARNALVVVTPAPNPAGLTTLADLPKAERVVLAGEAVPAGRYATELLRRAASAHGDDFPARVTARVVSRETHVRQVLQKVALGEADAAIVYATDAHSAGDRVTTVPIPDAINVIGDYPIATVRGAADPRLAAAFVDHVLSEQGAATLRAHGFLPPP